MANGEDMVTKLIIDRIDAVERNMLARVESVETNLGDRLDGANERLDRVNGRLGKHDDAIGKMLRDGCPRFEEHARILSRTLGPPTVAEVEEFVEGYAPAMDANPIEIVPARSRRPSNKTIAKAGGLIASGALLYPVLAEALKLATAIFGGK